MLSKKKLFIERHVQWHLKYLRFKRGNKKQLNRKRKLKHEEHVNKNKKYEKQ